MSLQISIDGLSGTSPYNIWICDNPETTCIYITTIDSAPITFDVPPALIYQNDWLVKSIDSNNCVSTIILTS